MTVAVDVKLMVSFAKDMSESVDNAFHSLLAVLYTVYDVQKAAMRALPHTNPLKPDWIDQVTL